MCKDCIHKDVCEYKKAYESINATGETHKGIFDLNIACKQYLHFVPEWKYGKVKDETDSHYGEIGKIHFEDEKRIYITFKDGSRTGYLKDEVIKMRYE